MCMLIFESKSDSFVMGEYICHYFFTVAGEEG